MSFFRYFIFRRYSTLTAARRFLIFNCQNVLCSSEWRSAYEQFLLYSILGYWKGWPHTEDTILVESLALLWCTVQFTTIVDHLILRWSIVFWISWISSLVPAFFSPRISSNLQMLYEGKMLVHQPYGDDKALGYVMPLAMKNQKYVHLCQLYIQCLYTLIKYLKYIWVM